MANKEALREFQNRLTQRLQSVQTTGVAVSWLAVESGQQELLFPLSHAGEIFPWTGVQHVPYVKPWFLGVANLRGNLFGAIDLAEFLQNDCASGIDDKQSRYCRAGNDWAQCRLVTLNPLLEAGCALLIDGLMGLRTLESFTRSEASPAGSPGYYGHVYTDTQQRQWQEISLQRLLLAPAFIDIMV